MNYKNGTSFVWVLIGIVLGVGIILVSSKYIGPEDDWICVEGEWIKHGNPSAPKPDTGCDSSETGTNFNKTGNIVRQDDVANWVLIYEEPGAPALSAVLHFSPKTKCKIGPSAVPCDDDDLWSEGSRVEVVGNISGKIINVFKLTVKN